jgi:tetratricopeptide (TPR) repeat protein
MKPTGAQRPSSTGSFDELVRLAEERFQQMDLDEAEKYYRLALKLQPKNTEIMDIIGEILIEKQKFDDAKKAKILIFKSKKILEKNVKFSHYYCLFLLLQMFLQSIRLQPNKGATKYMNMGQLESGIRALEYYRQGIHILLQEKALIEGGQVFLFLICDQFVILKQESESEFLSLSRVKEI